MVFCPSSRKEFRGKPKGINSRTVFFTFFLTSIGDFSPTTGISEPIKLSLKSDAEGEEEEEVDPDEDELGRTAGSVLDSEVKSKPKLSDLVKTASKERLPKKLDKKSGDEGEPFPQKTNVQINLLQILQKHGNLR